MGCKQSLRYSRRLCYLALYLLFLSILSSTQLRFMAQGREIPKEKNFSQTVSEDKAIVRARIGSRPPRCERRCSSCVHCEAIQVPTNPQVKSGTSKKSSKVSNVEYARGDDNNSNYKPMSWKCKCGNFIFNP
ncbi:EPIDERMAL PATTERNING FACTOR-like protein [Parasponia andersonii]|uniref:Epidermal patterning factor-like protein n=1 Tax=Parasponia andersonii TaxID=3476 RepID=A0A2P5AGH0_PARAD|nr:EPIDERMAL PATTERNING FACTOR-like protein [Parasponia andersonii]